MSAGLLYTELGERSYNLTEQEVEIVDLCVQYKLESDNEYTVDDVFEWYDDHLLDKSKLRRIIQKEVNIKLDARSDASKTEEGVNIKRVSKTYPSIVLTHFCKNTQITKKFDLKFPLGFYVFWEIIVPKVLKISQLLGCQYLYLFAADSSIKTTAKDSFQHIIYDIDDEESAITYDLVEYYKSEMKFEVVKDFTILKPHYDFECFSLFQPTNMLLHNRELSWIQHSDADE